MTEAIVSVRDRVGNFKDDVVEFDNEIHSNLIFETLDHIIDILERFIGDESLGRATRDSLTSRATRLTRMIKSWTDPAASDSSKDLSGGRIKPGGPTGEDGQRTARRRKRAPVAGGTNLPVAKRRSAGDETSPSQSSNTTTAAPKKEPSLYELRSFWSDVSQTYRWDREVALLVLHEHLSPGRADLLTLYAFTLVESRTSHQTTAMAMSRAVQQRDTLPSIFLQDTPIDPSSDVQVPSSQMTTQRPHDEVTSSQLIHSEHLNPERVLADLALQEDLLDISSSILTIRRRTVQYRAYCVRKTLLENVSTELGRPTTSSIVKERANKLTLDQYSLQYASRFGTIPNDELTTRLYTRLRNMVLRGQKWATLVDAAGGDPWALTLLYHPNIPDSRLTDLSLREWRLIVEITERVSPLRLGQSRSYMSVLSERMREVVKGKLSTSQSSTGSVVDDSFIWSHKSLGWVQDSEDELSQGEDDLYARSSQLKRLQDTEDRSRGKGRSVRFRSSIGKDINTDEDEVDEDEDVMDEDVQTQSTIL